MDATVRELTTLVYEEHPIVTASALTRIVIEREKTASTIVAPGIAAPHAIIEDELPTTIAVGVSPAGIAWEGPRETETVHVVVLLVGSRSSHLAVLSQFAARLQDRSLYETLIRAKTPRQIYDALVAVPGESREVPEPVFDINSLVLRHAMNLQDELTACVTVVHADTIVNLSRYKEIIGGREIIFVSTDPDVLPAAETFPGARSIVVPFHGTASQKHNRFVLLFLFSNGHLTPYQTVVGLTGVPEVGRIDSIRVVELREAFGPTDGLQQLVLPDDLDRSVFARVLQLAEDIALEGREGKPVGALFVLGDYDAVAGKTRQLIVNPFRGYPERERSILDPTLDETVKEFAKIDGAFLIRGDGVIASAGTFLAGQPSSADHHSGLGARHAAAQGITAVTRAIAIVISESTRSVSVFHGGRRILVT